MRKKTRKIKRRQPSGEMLYRIASVQTEGIDREKRSIPLVLATETPCDAFDFSRMEIVQEVLVIDGAELPSQVPLLDSHESDSMRAVLGSIRDLEKRNGKIVGRAYFASDEHSQKVFNDYADGHVQDFSVGAARQAVRYEGGTRFVTRSKIFEGSAVVRGADPNAKVLLPALRAYLDPQAMREEAMFEALKEILVKRGMPKDLENDKDILEWLERKFEESPPTDTKETDELKRILLDLKSNLPKPAKPEGDSQPTPEEQLKVERQRIKDITDLCRKHNVNDEKLQGWIDNGANPDEVARKILADINASGAPIGDGGTRTTESEREKFYAAARDGLVTRCVQASRLSPHNALEQAKKTGDVDAIQRSQTLVNTFEKPAEGHQEFRGVGFVELARMFLDRAGERISAGATRQDIIRRAIQQSNFVEMSRYLQRGDGAYNVTGSFSNLMLDAANKTLLAAYDESPFTYTMWVRQAPSASDFKQLNRIRFGELPDPEVVPENHPYPEKQTSDDREYYRVEKYGEMFSISMEALVNDDLNALTRIPQMQGMAMRRKINKVCYAILTSNPNLSDGIALFHASSHGANLDSNALAKTALDTGFTVMRTQTGLSGTGTILGIRPRYLIVPSALAATAYTLTASVADPSVGGDTTGSSGVRNIYGPGGPRPLMTVEEPQLDDSSATGWYLAADSSQIDTVELTFLQGEESPVLERQDGFEVDSVKYKIRQSFAAKAIDYRGLYKGNT